MTTKTQQRKAAKAARIAAKTPDQNAQAARKAAVNTERERLAREKAAQARLLARQDPETRSAIARLSTLPADIIEVDGTQYRIEADGSLTELSKPLCGRRVTPLPTAPITRSYMGGLAVAPKSPGENAPATHAPATHAPATHAQTAGGTAESAKAAISAAAERARLSLPAAEILADQPSRPGIKEFYQAREQARNLTGQEAFDLAWKLFSRFNLDPTTGDATLRAIEARFSQESSND